VPNVVWRQGKGLGSEEDEVLGSRLLEGCSRGKKLSFELSFVFGGGGGQQFEKF
jgi:hypothetical protein